MVVGGEPGLGFRATAVDPAGGVSEGQLVAAPMLEGATIVPRVVLAAGDGTTVAGVGGDEGVALAHLAADGTPDWSVYEPDAGRLLRAALGPGGEIAVVTLTGNLLRYTPDGERDATFGTGGVVDMDFTPTGVEILGDGRVLVAGYDFNGLRAERYTAEGALDPSFSGDGRFTLPAPGGGFFAVNDLTLQTDGKAVITGADDRDMVLIRLTQSGALDPAFSEDGIANGLRWSAGDLLRTGWSGAAFADGGLFVDGPRRAVRLSADGALDWSFVSDVFGAANSRPDEDGRVVVAQPIPNTDRTRFARLDPDGALDPLFGTRELALGESRRDRAGGRRCDAGGVGGRRAARAPPPARRRRDPAGPRRAEGLLERDRARGRQRRAGGAGHARSRSGVVAGRHLPAHLGRHRAGGGGLRVRRRARSPSRRARRARRCRSPCSATPPTRATRRSGWRRRR